MYVVGTVRNLESGELLPVMSAQAGGCTVSELDKENRLRLCAAAAETYGGDITEYEVTLINGYYDTRSAAETIVKYWQSPAEADEGLSLPAP